MTVPAMTNLACSFCGQVYEADDDAKAPTLCPECVDLMNALEQGV